MTNEEHLLENAICILEKSKYKEKIDTLEYNYLFLEFADNDNNIAMSNLTGISLPQIWSMASYVVFNLKPSWEEEENKCLMKLLINFGKNTHTERTKNLLRK